MRSLLFLTMLLSSGCATNGSFVYAEKSAWFNVHQEWPAPNVFAWCYIEGKDPVCIRPSMKYQDGSVPLNTIGR